MSENQSLDIFQSIRKDAFGALEEASDFETVHKIEAEYIGKSGRLTKILKSLKEMSLAERKEMGSTANALKKEIEEKIKLKKEEFGERGGSNHRDADWIDITAPGKKISRGHIHPISRVLKEVTSIFESMGFEVVEGPEVETEHYNFDALNIPKEHPARDLWDTFWIKPLKNGLLLRTHTSPNQIRYMEKHQPPLRIIVPGQVFRYEASDSSHGIQFYQLEGLMVDKTTSVANFKALIEQFFKKLFKENIQMRIRPGYFPFVEPGFEVDIKDRSDKWLEVIGAGMIHPQILKNVKLDPSQWQGFAFGMGLDRITMMKYKIDDIRLFHSGDLRFIRQF
ncbi:MAG: phenylalanine--tRNA ligase subunit alpha [Candidatus Tagabacteria bacterium CG_4_10_14_0_2_um_filter_40_13]|uniref:Phenylalanine--tRNA ligase alpha subunit n=3 Tax=Candidatus Tagaibacteriota TaxID=1817918 RepID=A0A2M7B9G3_9BACT|nr:MAG: phenylalanine--tRNA ligase subunit alpha [Candidatus Tagabacteria bacterium CG11_big_fil_rev_8_21_14_0_20_41_11]PIU99756.1 MAG: phenylalanine--tRNA ligase subunit alpha [Candidatus Tagabacteria bacterium CG03_land_8_20_14_0_80_41_22]PIZ56270.1 MAG: phenylalanine--tRNA ligase subunit alpha [Candidatus Tagabacteria bacterium CG_4_10_14_0_2_um_filter_40_13]PJC25076.1 MAG: phenylalanine--tRNA ligase subunit alpha [Candidatus Tagabacteria bacterium CG_4_9_14_0_2_um_filter_41_11]